MGWQDSITNIVFTIQTGDGKKFTPLWQPGEFSKEYNQTAFEYIDVPGSYVARKQPRARRFPMTFFFQGDDCIDQAKAFDTSADDPRPWVLHHPYYGNLNVQPIEIRYNNTAYNVSEVTCDLWETITISLPAATIDVQDNISDKVIACAEISPVDYSNKVALKPTDLTGIVAYVNGINARVQKVLTDADYSDYTNSINSTFNALGQMLTDPSSGITAIENTILQPASFSLSVVARTANITSFMIDALAAILIPTRNNSAFYEAVGGLTVASFASAVANPLPTDYVTRADVATQSDALSTLYQSYLTQMDALYNDDPNSTIAYSASQGTQNALQDLVLATLSGLSQIAFNAKQERVIMTEKDSNLIVLTQRYMGLDPDDNNINTFRTINKIKNNSIFLVKKGTQITYYV